MSEELLYTSAPQGLQPGSRGFCTVVRTTGMPKRLGERLESLSGYRHLFPPLSAGASRNPVNFSHLIVTLSGQRHHVLSRIADAGLDYTGRSNKLAHHVVLVPDELVAAGPASVLAADHFCETNWDGQLRELPLGRRPTQSVAHTGSCAAWQSATGDAGWAGVLAETALRDESPAMSVIVQADQPTLPLVVEANGLLPASRRWDVTFSTYFTRLPAGVDCQWRFLLDGTPEARAARRNPHAAVVDLCRSLPAAAGGVLVEQARTGRRPASESTGPVSHEVATSESKLRVPSPVRSRIESRAPLVAGEPLAKPKSLVRSLERMRFDKAHLLRRKAVLAGIVATLLLGVIVAAAWRIGETHEVTAQPGGPSIDGPKFVELPKSGPVSPTEWRRRPAELAPSPPNPPSSVATVPGPATSPRSSLPKKKVEPRPLDVVRRDRFVELPAFNVGLSTVAKSGELLPLAVEPTRCELRLRGSECVLGSGKELELVRRESPDECYWDVRETATNAKGLGDGKLIGWFRLAEGKLTFGWSSRAAMLSVAALRQSLLSVHIGDDHERVFLSRPKTIDPISLDLSRAETVRPVSLDPKHVATMEDLHYQVQVVLDGLYLGTGYVDRRHSKLDTEIFRQIDSTPWIPEPGIPDEVKMVLRQGPGKGLNLHASLFAPLFVPDGGDAFPGQLPRKQRVWRARIKQLQSNSRRGRREFRPEWRKRVLAELQDIEQRLRIHLRCYVFVDDVEMELLKTTGWDELARSFRRGTRHRGTIRTPASNNRPTGISQEPGK